MLKIRVSLGRWTRTTSTIRNLCSKANAITILLVIRSVFEQKKKLIK